MLKLHLCVLFLLLQICDTFGVTTSRYYRYSSPPTTTTKPSSPTITTPACAGCPSCPLGYVSTYRDYSCECLCRYYGGSWNATTTPAKPVNSLLIRLLSNIGNNAESISQMAQSLKDELQLAQELV